MNANHLTENVRKQVVTAVQDLRKKNSPNGEEVKKFVMPYYKNVAMEMNNDFDSFLELCILEIKYGFVKGYMGGANL